MDSEEELLIVTSSDESSTDEEFEERLQQTQRAQERDKAHDALWELFRENNIDSKLNGLINNDVIEEWLRAGAQMEDIIRGDRLKKENSTFCLIKLQTTELQSSEKLQKRLCSFTDPVLHGLKVT